MNTTTMRATHVKMLALAFFVISMGSLMLGREVGSRYIHTAHDVASHALSAHTGGPVSVIYAQASGALGTPLPQHSSPQKTHQSGSGTTGSQLTTTESASPAQEAQSDTSCKPTAVVPPAATNAAAQKTSSSSASKKRSVTPNAPDCVERHAQPDVSATPGAAGFGTKDAQNVAAPQTVMVLRPTSGAVSQQPDLPSGTGNRFALPQGFRGECTQTTVAPFPVSSVQSMAQAPITNTFGMLSLLSDTPCGTLGE